MDPTTGTAGVVGHPLTAVTVWLDTDTASRAVAAWTALAEHLHRTAFQLERRLAELALAEHTAAAQELTSAATELWGSAALARRALDAARRGDATFDPGDAPHLDVTRGPGARFSPAAGDRGRTGSRELRTPYAPSSATPVARGRDLVVRALTDTAHPRRLRPDEFGLVEVAAPGDATTRYVVVLPGVVDLSTIELGWNRAHRSVRDLDRAAIGSARSTGTADNPYARLVASGLVAAGVPPGSELLVVGHSFGADTALDLAADPTFNGPGRYRVTHVVAAGYHSVPQLARVDAGTEVLVLQNHRDVPVIVEAIADAHVAEAVSASAGTVAALLTVDPVGAVAAHARAVGHQLAAAWAAARHVVRRADAVTDVAVGVATADGARIAAGAGGIVTLVPGLRSPAAGQVVSVFAGGGHGAGHHQSNYTDHVRHATDPAVVAFLESVDRAGYTAAGTSVAIDVSVPSTAPR